MIKSAKPSAAATPGPESPSTCASTGTRLRTVLSDPKDDDYREHCARPFGKPVTLSEPFAFDLDTADLL
ncbi:hypothetical protein [Streptomyces sp. Go-475]|uniref:hypothetical protein n=1 Tax=Streptomyces sp. Go-475 TaxID=2072505 RepID=UPI001E399D44|nr:hypothetical protein [Streptomyces sp. Go-475]